jgi:hypothetical protein
MKADGIVKYGRGLKRIIHAGYASLRGRQRSRDAASPTSPFMIALNRMIAEIDAKTKVKKTFFTLVRHKLVKMLLTDDEKYLIKQGINQRIFFLEDKIFELPFARVDITDLRTVGKMFQTKEMK